MKIFIHGWASGPQVWPASLTKGESFLYDGEEFPEFSDLEQTVKKLWQTRREKMIVVGWSLGGMLALQLAHAHPEWIEKLVLLSSTSRFTTDGLYTEGLPPSSVKSLSRRLNRRQRETQKNFYWEMFADAETEAAEKFSEISPVFFSLPGTGLQKGLNYLLQTDLRDILPQIRVPVAILHGEADEICPPAAARYMASLLPTAKLKLFPGAGHVLFFSHLAEVLKIIEEGITENG
ncbi:MAG: alpha/beta fold hydrolase [Selenomonadaceae bacterium]